MPDDLSLLDQLEEWLEAQVPTNLHELPMRMLDRMERMSNEIFEVLNQHAPPSISIPFPPFGKEVFVPPPPPPPSLPVLAYQKADKLFRAHPYAVGAGALTVVAVGLGVGGAVFKFGLGSSVLARVQEKRRSRWQGRVQDGVLKEAIVLLAPSPMPPLLWNLAVSLLKAKYIVIVAVPSVDDAELLEKRLGLLEERSALRVLIYDPDDATTFPPFHRSLIATLTLRFPAAGAHQSGDPYNPEPSHLPIVQAFVSLYPLHPRPPSQPGALPALPTLLEPENNRGRAAKLVTLYPSAAVLATPDTFASQILVANHQLLARNLAASSSAKTISVFIGDVALPNVLGQVSNKVSGLSEKGLPRPRGLPITERVRLFFTRQVDSVFHATSFVLGRLGLGHRSRDYVMFERSFLRLVRSRFNADSYSLGQYSYLPFLLARAPLPALPTLLSIMPAMPSTRGPTAPDMRTVPRPSRPTASSGKVSGAPSAPPSASATSSDHESVEDLGASMHSLPSRKSATSSERAEDSETSSAHGNNLGESWVGLDGSVSA